MAIGVDGQVVHPDLRPVQSGHVEGAQDTQKVKGILEGMAIEADARLVAGAPGEVDSALEVVGLGHAGKEDQGAEHVRLDQRRGLANRLPGDRLLEDVAAGALHRQAPQLDGLRPQPDAELEATAGDLHGADLLWPAWTDYRYESLPETDPVWFQFNQVRDAEEGPSLADFSDTLATPWRRPMRGT